MSKNQFSLLLAILIVLILWSVIHISTTTPSAHITKLNKTGEVKDVIQTEVNGTTVYYREEVYWSKDCFLRIIKNKDEFISNFTKGFISRVTPYGMKVLNLNVALNEEDSSTILTCEVYNSVSKNGNKYYATFEWLIRPLGLDFIDNHFTESIGGLSWKGKINGIPTEITCKFPYTGLPYNAWAQPTGHCHAHVWRKL